MANYGYNPKDYINDFSWVGEIGNSISKFAYQVPEIIKLNKTIKENNKAKDILYSSVNKYIDKLDGKVVSNIVSSMKLDVDPNDPDYDTKARQALKKNIPTFSEVTKNEEYSKKIVDYFVPVIRAAQSNAGSGPLKYSDLMSGVDNESITEGVNQTTYGKQQLSNEQYDLTQQRKEEEYKKETEMMYGQGGRNEQAVQQQQRLTDEHTKTQNLKTSDASQWAIDGATNELGEPLSLSNINKVYTKAIAEGKKQAKARDIDPSSVVNEIDNYFKQQKQFLIEASMEKDRQADNERTRKANIAAQKEKTFKEENPPVNETQLAKANQTKIDELNRAKLDRQKLIDDINNQNPKTKLKGDALKQAQINLRNLDGKIRYLETYSEQTQKTLNEFGAVEGPYAGTRTAAAPIQKRQQMEADIDRNVQILSDYKDAMINVNKKGKVAVYSKFGEMVKDGVAGEPGQNRPFILFKDKIAINPKYNAFLDFLKTGKRPSIEQVYSPQQIKATQEPTQTGTDVYSANKEKIRVAQQLVKDPNADPTQKQNAQKFLDSLGQ